MPGTGGERVTIACRADSEREDEAERGAEALELHVVQTLDARPAGREAELDLAGIRVPLRPVDVELEREMLVEIPACARAQRRAHALTVVREARIVEIGAQIEMR